MKKALDYVSDYQLKPACKHAICIAPSKVTQLIFAVLEDWYHHIVLTHSCKLVVFLYRYRLWRSSLQHSHYRVRCDKTKNLAGDSLMGLKASWYEKSRTSGTSGGFGLLGAAEDLTRPRFGFVTPARTLLNNDGFWNKHTTPPLFICFISTRCQKFELRATVKSSMAKSLPQRRRDSTQLKCSSRLSSSSSSTTVGSMPVGVWRHSYYRCPPLPI